MFTNGIRHETSIEYDHPQNLPCRKCNVFKESLHNCQFNCGDIASYTRPGLNIGLSLPPTPLPERHTKSWQVSNLILLEFRLGVLPRLSIHIPKERMPYKGANRGLKCRYLGESSLRKSKMFLSCNNHDIHHSRDIDWFPGHPKFDVLFDECPRLESPHASFSPPSSPGPDSDEEITILDNSSNETIDFSPIEPTITLDNPPVEKPWSVKKTFYLAVEKPVRRKPPLYNLNPPFC